MLNQHPAIQQTLVIARDELDGDKRLIAYIVTTDPHSVTTSALRQFLQATLPEYMIPAVFVTLPMTLTPNGKIDHHALPAPDLPTVVHESYTAPRTSLEQELASTSGPMCFT